MTSLQERDSENWSYLPKIKRAREYRVYGADSVTYLDLFRADGSALLGYSVPGLGSQVKARIDQHLWASLPHVTHERLIRELSLSFPEYEVFCFANSTDAERLFQELRLEYPYEAQPRKEDILNDTELVLQGERGSATYQVWLPFTPRHAEIIKVILPCIGGGIEVYLVSPALFIRFLLSQEIQTYLRSLAWRLAPYVCESMLACLPFLRQWGAFGTEGLGPHTGGRTYESSLGYWREAHWDLVKIASWKRLGPYLLHQFNPSDYQTVFRFALKQKILLNPRYEGVSILPGLMSLGEEARLRDVLAFSPEVSHGL